MALAFACVAACAPPAHEPRRAPAARPPGAALERDAIIAGRRLRYHLQLAEQPNLVYQLDCVTGVALCAQAIYAELWDTFGLDAGDRAALATWKSLRVRYGGELRRVDRTRPPQPLLAPAGVHDLAERQRIAGLRARTPATYEASMALVSSDADARRLRGVIERFAPRFAAWWRRRGFASGAAFFDGFRRLLADRFLDSTVDKAARFYESDLPAGTVFRVHVLVQPRSARKLTVAYQLEGDAVVEAREDGRPEGLIDVVAHELFHYLFFRADPRRQAALLEAVCASSDPYAVVAFGMLDEAVAAALGNGVVGGHYMAPEAFARSRARGFIQYQAAGAVAREILPALPGFLDGGAAISSPEFVRAFTAAARATFPGGRPRPLDYLHAQVSVAEPRFAGAARRLNEAAWASFPNLREFAGLDAGAASFMTAHPFISATLFLPRDAHLATVLAPLAPGARRLAAIAALARRARGFVYALPRTDKSYAFVVVADDEPTMVELVDRFVSLSENVPGALVELPR